MKGHYWVYIDAATAAAAAATHIAERLDEAVRDGDATSPLAEEIVRNCCSANLIKTGVDWTHVRLFWVDERAVPPGHEQSNHSMALEHLITPAGIPESNVVRMEGELALRGGRSLRTYPSRAFSWCCRSRLRRDPSRMGPDGHTASLFPGEPDPGTEETCCRRARG